MTKAKALLFVICCILLVSACKKIEEEIVPGNTPPPDGTIPVSIKENYVNKLYISVLGRKPDSLEYEQGKAILNKNNISVDNRKELVNSILAKPGYHDRIYTIARTDYLDGTDTSEITFQINTFKFFLSDTTYQYLWPILQMEIQRLDTLYAIPFQYNTQKINLVEVHKRCTDNYFYDQINMGTENFVVACFQNFLFRYPTNAELTSSKTMVDGQSSSVFFKSGKNKEDFIDIFFSSSDYFEGQVRDLYKKYLYREPTSEEMSARGSAYKNSLDYKALQREILILDEYVGIK